MWFARNSDECGGGIVISFFKPVRKYTVTDYGQGIGKTRYSFDNCWINPNRSTDSLLGNIETNTFISSLKQKRNQDYNYISEEDIEKLLKLTWKDEPIEIKITI